MSTSHEDYLSLIEQSNSLNSKFFSLPRIVILSSLALMKDDGITFRELKAVMQQSETTLYANLKYLEKNGHIVSEKVTFDNKTIEMFKITQNGFDEWQKVKDWLCKYLECGELADE